MYDHHKKFLIDFQIQKMSPRAAHVSMGRQGVRHGVILSKNPKEVVQQQ